MKTTANDKAKAEQVAAKATELLEQFAAMDMPPHIRRAARAALWQAKSAVEGLKMVETLEATQTMAEYVADIEASAIEGDDAACDIDEEEEDTDDEGDDEESVDCDDEAEAA